jgi:hypothetical protein
MLSLSGNSEQAFARLNSINANPVVWMEWNYNSLTKPYVVTSSSAGPVYNLSSVLNISSNWSTTYNGTIVSSAIGGRVFETDATSGSCIKLKTSTAVQYDKVTQTLSSFFGGSSASGYFKLVMYVKANQPNVIGNSLSIPATSISLTGSGTGVSKTTNYRVVPVSSNGIRPMYNANGLDQKSISGSYASVTISWPGATGVSDISSPAAYDIYRDGKFLITVPATSSNRSANTYTYVDNLSNTPTQNGPIPAASMKIKFAPSVRLFSSGNYRESTVSFARTVSEETSTIIKNDSSVYIDGSKYLKVEVFFGSDEVFDAAKIDLLYAGAYYGAEILICGMEIFQINKWDFVNTEYFPIESMFNANRPGEALLHPYLPSSDTLINKDWVEGGIKKPVSLVFNSPDYFISDVQPYRQLRNSLYNTYKYYVSPSTDMYSSKKIEIQARYKNYLDINKIIIKIAQGGSSDSRLTMSASSVSGSVLVLGPNYSVISTITIPAGSFDNSGILSLYYDGLSWSTTRGSWTPPTLTDSGILQNVLSNVTGLIYVSTITNNHSLLERNRMHFVEISPRLEIDVSNITEEINVSKTMDDSDSIIGFPIGLLNANSGTIKLHNIPVYKNTFPHTVFDVLSDSATFSDVLRQGVKFTVGLISPTNDFTDYVPFMTMYSDTWTINDLDSLDISIMDSAKYVLMGLESPPYLSWSEDIFSTIVNLFEISGFSDYDYDGLKEILSRRSKIVSAFWCDRNKSVFDTLKDFFVAYQIGASFDEYGIMRFYDIDSYIYQFSNINFSPDFSVSDIPITLTKSTGSVFYESNMIKDSYSVDLEKKVGKVIIDYKAPSRLFSEDKIADVNKSSWGRVTDITRPVFTESSTVGLPFTSFDISIKGLDNVAFMFPEKMSGKRSLQTIGTFNGYGFLQGELIKWNGLEYTFTTNRNDSSAQPQTVTRVCFSEEDRGLVIQDLFAADPAVTQVNHHPTGNVVGLERGLRNTSVRDHLLYDESAVTPYGYAPASAVPFNKKYISYNITRPSPSITPSITSNSISSTSVKITNNVAKFSVQKSISVRPFAIALSPKQLSVNEYAEIPTSASNFDYFSVTFTGPDYSATKFSQNQSTAELGIYINTISGHPIMIGLRNLCANIVGENQCFVGLSQFSKYGKPTTGHLQQVIPNWSDQVQTKNVFDGKQHRLGIIMSWNDAVPTASVYVDNNYVTVINLTHAAGTPAPKKSNATEWGVYVENPASPIAGNNILNIDMHEVYACSMLDNKLYSLPCTSYTYHWQNPVFLNKLIKNIKSPEPLYFYWGPNILTGVHIYDKVDFNLQSPVFEQTVSYDRHFSYTPGTAKADEGQFHKTKFSDISLSTPFCSPFNFSSIIVNNSAARELVFLGRQDNQINGQQITPFSIDANFLKLSDSNKIERIIDPANINNSITLNTTWIQSPSDAEELLRQVEFLASSFSTTVNVSIFGNPLIQVGDICKLTYSLKKVGYDPENSSVTSAYCMVKEVSNSFTGGLTTSLKLKPMFKISSTMLE